LVWAEASPTTKMAAWTSSDLAGAYGRLLDTGVAFIVVGGQAVNLWAEHYRQRLPRTELDSFAPLASRDLDLLGGSVDVERAGRALQVDFLAVRPRERTDSPHTGTLHLPVAGRDELTVQFIHTPVGANPAEVRKTARPLAWHGCIVPVMHPLLCLESKVACLCRLAQEGRQDEKHARLCLVLVREFIAERLTPENERELREIIARVLDLAGDERGLCVWHEHGIRVEESLPISAMRETAGALPKIAGFLENEWPRREMALAELRASFGEIARRRAEAEHG